MGEETSREELWTLYKTAIDEKNFQVTLNWDRTKFYFLFNAALFSIGGGFARFDRGEWKWAEVVIFALAALNSFFAAHAIRKGHGYYREARKHLKGVERKLGIINEEGSEFALKATRGMVRETEGKIRIPFGERFTITNANICLQMIIGVVSLVSILYVVHLH